MKAEPEKWRESVEKQRMQLLEKVVIPISLGVAITRLCVTSLNGSLYTEPLIALSLAIGFLISISYYSFIRFKKDLHTVYCLSIVEISAFVLMSASVTVFNGQSLPFAIYSTVVYMVFLEYWVLSPGVSACLLAKHYFAWLVFWGYCYDFPLRSLLLPSGFLGLVVFVVFWRLQTNMISLRKDIFTAKNQAQERLQLIEAILEAIPTGVLVLEKEGKIAHGNPAILKMLHVRSQEQILDVVSGLKYMENQRYLWEDIMYFISSDENGTGHLGATVEEGIVLSWSITRAKEASSLSILTCNDITELVTLANRARSESESKSALLSSVTHELRTPLNVLINLAEDVQTHERVTEEAAHKLSIMRTSGRILLHVVNDLLDFSQLVAGSLRIAKTEFNVRDVVKSVVGLVEYQCQAKNLYLDLKCADTVPETIFSDPNRLSQVLLNLLSNAFKFTKEGSITVNVQNEALSLLSISVRDTGIGIAPEQVSRLFHPFSKLLDSGGLNRQGCGLGLWISNQLVRALGGQDIQIVSEAGKGSIFTFNLPIISEPKRRINQSLSQALVSPEQFKVLVVDDNVFNCMVITTMLKSIQVACEEANSAEEALVKLQKNEDFSMVLLDLEMPEIDGFQCMQTIMHLHEAGKIGNLPPVIAHSAVISESDTSNCEALGFAGAVEKPISRDKMIELLSKFSSTD